MARCDRFQSLKPGRPHKLTVSEVGEMLRREIKRRAVRGGHIEDPAQKLPKWEFHWKFRDFGGMSRANTKAEAIALIKADMGVKKLPASIEIVRVEPKHSHYREIAELQGPNDQLIKVLRTSDGHLNPRPKPTAASPAPR